VTEDFAIFNLDLVVSKVLLYTFSVASKYTGEFLSTFARRLLPQNLKDLGGR